MDTSIRKLDVSAYTVPTDAPEADGTLQWNSTTLVLVELDAGGAQGLGYTYTHSSAARLIHEALRAVIEGHDALAVSAAYRRMLVATRNIGQTGIVAGAISAVDTALWDLKARLLGTPLVNLFGPVREHVSVYGSGGFTSYSRERLCEQLAGWVEQGISRVKMKVGQSPERDVERVRAARRAIGQEAQLFVDANGAYDRQQALAMAAAFADEGVTWFEEPVTSGDLRGLQLVRDRSPAGMEITTGEYGWNLQYFRDLLGADAVDVLQADATRCGGFTGFFGAATLAQAHELPLSAHTAPTLHAAAACALWPVRHIEWFHDHVRIEQIFFDGFVMPAAGSLRANQSDPGMGFVLKRAEADHYLVWKA